MACTQTQVYDREDLKNNIKIGFHRILQFINKAVVVSSVSLVMESFVALQELYTKFNSDFLSFFFSSGIMTLE